MSKTKKITEPVQKDPNRLYSIEDSNEILRLFKVANASREDCDSIYRLYKKYIKPRAPMYQTNCRCRTSISAYYQELLSWFSKNRDKFETE